MAGLMQSTLAGTALVCSPGWRACCCCCHQMPWSAPAPAAAVAKSACLDCYVSCWPRSLHMLCSCEAGPESVQLPLQLRPAYSSKAGAALGSGRVFVPMTGRFGSCGATVARVASCEQPESCCRDRGNPACCCTADVSVVAVHGGSKDSRCCWINVTLGSELLLCAASGLRQKH